MPCCISWCMYSLFKTSISEFIMSIPKLLNENPKRYLCKLFGLRGNVIQIDNTSVYRLPTKNLSYNKFLEILDKKLNYLKSKNLVVNVCSHKDYITFTLNTTSKHKQVCISKRTGIELFIPTM